MGLIANPRITIGRSWGRREILSAILKSVVEKARPLDQRGLQELTTSPKVRELVCSVSCIYVIAFI